MSHLPPQISVGQMLYHVPLRRDPRSSCDHSDGRSTPDLASCRLRFLDSNMSAEQVHISQQV
jgi:hypothetical protein